MAYRLGYRAIPNRRSVLCAGFRPVEVCPNPIFPTLPCLPTILQDRDLYQSGGIYYGIDTRWAEYEMVLKPQDRHRDDYPLGNMPAGLS